MNMDRNTESRSLASSSSLVANHVADPVCGASRHTVLGKGRYATPIQDGSQPRHWIRFRVKAEAAGRDEERP